MSILQFIEKYLGRVEGLEQAINRLIADTCISADAKIRDYRFVEGTFAAALANCVEMHGEEQARELAKTANIELKKISPFAAV